MRMWRLPVPIIAGMCCSAHVHAEASGTSGTLEAPEHDYTWHGRVGFGLNPVARDPDELPAVHAGFGASLSGFVHLPYRISAGVGFDWERYTFDSKNYGDPPGSAARYTDEVLTHTRLMALVQWDVLRHRFVTPYILAGLGYGWEDAELTEWQCGPALMSGVVVGGGAGLDVAVHELIGIGLEYRINTLPKATATCTLAFISDEPMGPPSDFVSQRIGITLSMRY
jgi:opacity protein-like surface antigen